MDINALEQMFTNGNLYASVLGIYNGFCIRWCII